MFHRALITGIILFWLVMTGLLVRVEFFSGRGDLLPIPISHVAKLVFIHQQVSDLVLYQKRERLGNIHLLPQLIEDPENPPDGMLELLGCTGGFSLRLPGVPYKRATFRFNSELNTRHEMRRFECTVTLHNPQQPEPSVSLQFDGRPPRDEYHYAVRSGEVTVKENTGTIAALLDDPALQVFPVNPRVLLAQAEASAAGSPSAPGRVSINARRGTLPINGEEIETYVVTIRVADSLESTVHVSQLGQILAVKTFAGYDLYDEALSP